VILLNIARVFPRRTKATPDDALAFTTPPPKILADIDEVHISVTFSYDMEKAEQLAEAWQKTGLPVLMGGAAFNEPGGEFVPGRYLKQGYVITSRGCPNRCSHCSVPQREGYTLRELEIKDGFNILDDNLLSCSDNHIREVFEMLKRQPESPVFTGGLEARLLKSWHVDLLRSVKAKRMYFAYDTPDEYEPLIQAGRLLRDGGISKASQAARCYVFVGYGGDTLENAEKRLRDTWAAGFFPFAMLFRDEKGEVQQDWKSFQRIWARPQIVNQLLKED
jgi:hypothetical protein